MPAMPALFLDPLSALIGIAAGVLVGWLHFRR
jgi:hypothetical protein